MNWFTLESEMHFFRIEILFCCSVIAAVTSHLFSLLLPGPEDNIAEYYQQQVEMLEGFNEMDALADRGFVPRMSQVCLTSLLSFCHCVVFCNMLIYPCVVNNHKRGKD